MHELVKDTTAYQTMRSSIRAHAYLLCTDDQDGLKLILKEFAPLFFPASDRAKTLIEKECFPDCAFYPKSGDRLNVPDVEEILEECSLRPVEGNVKLFVIPDVALSTAQAQNKLLKILEEPPEGVYFLLGASSPYLVLPTVLSRCVRFDLPPFAEEKIKAYLLRLGASDERAEESSALSEGYVGRAREYAFGEHGELLSLAKTLATASPSALPALVKKSGDVKEKRTLLFFLRLLFCDALMLKTGNGRYVRLKKERETSEKIASAFSARALLKAQTEFSKAEKNVQFYAVLPQTIEILFTQIYRENGQ